MSSTDDDLDDHYGTRYKRPVHVGELVTSVFDTYQIGLLVGVVYEHDEKSDSLEPLFNVLWSDWGLEERVEEWLIYPAEAPWLGRYEKK